MTKRCLLFTDNGIKGHIHEGGKGVIASAFAIFDYSANLITEAFEIEHDVTNNYGEMKAIRMGLIKAKLEGFDDIKIISDSQLCVNWINGVYQIENENVLSTYLEVKELLKVFEKSKVIWVSRDYNVYADWITALFDSYISPKILKELDVRFTEEELLKQLREILSNNPELSAEDYSVKDIKSYNSETSLYYQISLRYGSGLHALIPNTAGIGVGRNEDLRYCSLEEFKEHNLSVDSISIERMMRYLKPFYTTKEEVFDLQEQTQ